MRRRLQLLSDQGYIYRRYSAKDRQQNNYASYCLAPKGINALQGQPVIKSRVLHAAYRDRTASDQFVAHCLHILRLYRKIEQLYPGKFSILTKSETTGFDYYPDKLPDLHLEDTSSGQSYFLDIVEADTMSFITRQKLTGYSHHCYEGSWEAAIDQPYPMILLVCATPQIEASLQRRIPRWINNEEITVYTTSYRSLVESTSPADRIWSNVDEPEEKVNLQLHLSPQKLPY